MANATGKDTNAAAGTSASRVEDADEEMEVDSTCEAASTVASPSAASGAPSAGEALMVLSLRREVDVLGTSEAGECYL